MTKRGTSTGSNRTAVREVNRLLETQIEKVRQKRAQIVLGKMLDLNLAGKRLADLFIVIDRDAAYRGLGNKSFPLVIEICAQIGRYTVWDIAFEQGSIEELPVDILDVG